ncbi:myelin and lymphocyte protein-like [Hemiscyllium ocellatum]|uniref:myelin and lymphocyte protein-like n=1 Tax=Hemiscyllium ocellatum TaxID=170820 RepID=UPI0029663DDF|nr:myelin and lymphocyte protein-like [Hemiscyllium ocellatum]
MSAPATSTSPIPSGGKVCITFPEILMLGEFVFGGLVWILVASARVAFPPDQGWVMFVSVFCFVITTLLLILYTAGVQNSSTAWMAVDVFYHFIAAVFYLSCAVLEASDTRFRFFLLNQVHKINIAASVFAFVATLLYTIHAVMSILRWKNTS